MRALPSHPLRCARQTLDELGTFYEFLEHICRLTKPMPMAFGRCFLAACVLIVGEIIVSKYHVRYYTVWYYENKLSRAGKVARLQAAQEQKVVVSRQDEKGASVSV